MSNEPTTLAELIEHQADMLGDRPFLFHEDRVVSFSELNSETNRVAHALQDLGVKPGVGVAIMMPNSPEWLFVYFGVQKLGGYAVPVNVALKGAGLSYIVDHSDSSILVCDVEYVEAVVAVQEDLPKISNIIATRCGVVTETTVPEDWIELGTLMQASSEENANASVEMGQIAGIMYTSGTTGNPKGVVQRHGPIRMGADSGLAPKLEPTDILYTCLPLFHANALSLSVRRALTHGLPVAVARRFSASRFWSDIRRYGATTFNALGAMMPILMKQPEREDDADNPVRVVFSAACPASVWEAFENRFDVHIHEIYAAVDGGGFATSNPGNAPTGSIGKPTNTYRIVGDDGEDVAVDAPGELWWKIDNPGAQTVEYYKNVEASDDKIAGGWLHTGDVVRADVEGYLYFVDRKTESLRRRGENISSYEVEREINKHPAVLESAVFGVPSDLGEDDVMAVVVLKPGQTLTPEALIEHCESVMAYFMVPRYLEFRSELPKTGTQRTQKGELKRQGVGPNTWDREKTA